MIATYATEEALREALEALNEFPHDPKVVGIDQSGTPFMAQLSGVYAESVTVTLNMPWDSEVEYRTALRSCEECGAQGHWSLAVLAFPVTVLSAAPA